MGGLGPWERVWEMLRGKQRTFEFFYVSSYVNVSLFDVFMFPIMSQKHNVVTRPADIQMFVVK